MSSGSSSPKGIPLTNTFQETLDGHFDVSEFSILAKEKSKSADEALSQQSDPVIVHSPSTRRQDTSSPVLSLSNSSSFPEIKTEVQNELPEISNAQQQVDPYSVEGEKQKDKKDPQNEATAEAALDIQEDITSMQENKDSSYVYPSSSRSRKPSLLKPVLVNLLKTALLLIIAFYVYYWPSFVIVKTTRPQQLSTPDKVDNKIEITW